MENEEHKCHICGKPATMHLESLDLWYCDKHFWEIAYILVSYKGKLVERIKKILERKISVEEFEKLPQTIPIETRKGHYFSTIKKLFLSNGIVAQFEEGKGTGKCNICGKKHKHEFRIKSNGYVVFRSGADEIVDFFTMWDFVCLKNFLKKQIKLIKGGKYGQVGKGVVSCNEPKSVDR